MDESGRAARAAARAARITAEVVRPGDAADAARPLRGAPAVALATELTRASYALLGRPVVRIPRSEWPVVRRTLREDESTVHGDVAPLTRLDVDGS